MQPYDTQQNDIQYNLIQHDDSIMMICSIKKHKNDIQHKKHQNGIQHKKHQNDIQH